MPRKKYAILIGIETYSNLEPAEHAVADVRDLANALKDYCGFTTIRKLCQADGEGAMQPDEVEPTEESISREISMAAAMLGPDDLFLLFAAGHGQDYNGRTFLLSQNYDQGSLSGEKIELSDFHSNLKVLEARQKVFIYDLCRDIPWHAGSVSSRSAGSPQAFTASMKHDLENLAAAAPSDIRTTWGILFACEAGQKAFSAPGASNGALTLGILEYLRRQKGKLTFTDLSSSVGHFLARIRQSNQKISQVPDVSIGGDSRGITLRDAPNTRVTDNTRNSEPLSPTPLNEGFDPLTGRLPLPFEGHSILVLHDDNTIIIGSRAGEIAALDLATGRYSKIVKAEDLRPCPKGENHYPSDSYFHLSLGLRKNTFYTLSPDGVLKLWIYEKEITLVTATPLLGPYQSQFNQLVVKGSKSASWSSWTCYNQGVPKEAPTSIIGAHITGDYSAIVILTDWFCVARLSLDGKLLSPPVTFPDSYRIHSVSDDGTKIVLGVRKPPSKNRSSLYLFNFETKNVELVKCAKNVKWAHEQFFEISRGVFWFNNIAIDIFQHRSEALNDFNFHSSRAMPVLRPDGKGVFIPRETNIFEICAKTGKALNAAFVQGHSETICGIDTFANNKQLASISEKTLVLWDIDSRKPVRRIFSPKDTLLLNPKPQFYFNPELQILLLPFQQIVFSIHRGSYVLLDQKKRTLVSYQTPREFIGFCRYHSETLFFDLTKVSEDQPKVRLRDHLFKKGPIQVQYLRINRLTAGNVTEVFRIKLVDQISNGAWDFPECGFGDSVEIHNNAVAILAGRWLMIFCMEKRIFTVPPRAINDDSGSYSCDSNVEVNSNGRIVLTWGNQTGLTLRDGDSLELLETLPEDKFNIHGILPHPDSRYSIVLGRVGHASYGGPTLLYLLDLETRKFLGSLGSIQDQYDFTRTNSFLFDSGTKLAYTASKKVIVLNLLEKNNSPSVIFEHCGTVRCIQYCPEENQICSVSDDGTAQFIALDLDLKTTKITSSESSQLLIAQLDKIELD